MRPEDTVSFAAQIVGIGLGLIFIAAFVLPTVIANGWIWWQIALKLWGWL